MKSTWSSVPFCPVVVWFDYSGQSQKASVQKWQDGDHSKETKVVHDSCGPVIKYANIKTAESSVGCQWWPDGPLSVCLTLDLADSVMAQGLCFWHMAFTLQSRRVKKGEGEKNERETRDSRREWGGKRRSGKPVHLSMKQSAQSSVHPG